MTSVEGRASWVVAFASLAILSFSFSSPLVVVVAMKQIAADLDVPREVPALAASMAWLGTGIGSVFMGWLADRIGVRWTVLFGGLMIGVGLAITAIGTQWALYLGQGLFCGLIGNAGVNTPLLVYVSRWFDKRRGTALALISSGQYIAGMIWPNVLEWSNARHGWQATAIFTGIAIAAGIVPLALIMLRPPPGAMLAAGAAAAPAVGQKVLGMHPTLTMALLGLAGFLCCVPMALPQGHLVAFCSDLGLANGASMLSSMLLAAFLARQFWGLVSDRVGGLYTILFGSIAQAVAMVAFMSTRDEAGLFAVTIAYGFGFSGIIPAYVLAVRQLFPAAEAGWRVPFVVFPAQGGMAFGGWFAGVVYDVYGSYAAAFLFGLFFSIGNLLIIGALLWRWRAGAPARRLAPA